MTRFRDLRAQGPKFDQPMEVLQSGECACGGTWMVTRTSGETRDRVRHSNPTCEAFDKLPASAYLQALRERKKLKEAAGQADGDAAETPDTEPEDDAPPAPEGLH